MSAFALSGYPLSQRFAALVEQSIGERPAYFTLSQVRALGLPGLLRLLWSLRRQRAVVPLEDDTTVALLPIISGLALLTLPRSIEVLRADLTLEPLRKRDIAASLVGLALASLRAYRAVGRARADARELMRAPPLRARVAARGRRLLYLNANLWFGLKAGGSVGHVAGVVNAFSAAGYEVDLATAPEPIMIRPEVNVIPLRPTSALGLPLELNYYDFQMQVRDLLRARREDYAFIYHRISVGNFTGALLARDLGVPLVVEYNGSEVWAARNWGHPLRLQGLAIQAEEVSFRHASHIVTISEPLIRELVARGVERDRIVFYPNCVDASIFDPERFSATDRAALRARNGIAEDAIVATFIGTFGRWHGVELLARVVAGLSRDEAGWLERERVCFVFVGDGGKMAEVRELLSGPAERFSRVVGLVPQHEAAAYLAASDILLSPHVPNVDGTEFFGSPTKLFEYMAMARGIVASRLGQITTVLSPALDAAALPSGPPGHAEERLGILIRPGSQDELREGIRFLVERPDWRSRLGSNARRRVLDRFTWKHHVAAILEKVEHRDGGNSDGAA